MLFQANNRGTMPIELFIKEQFALENFIGFPCLISQVMQRRCNNNMVPMLNVLVRRRPQVSLKTISSFIDNTPDKNMRNLGQPGKPTALHEAILRKDIKLVELMVRHARTKHNNSTFDFTLALEEDSSIGSAFQKDCLYLCCQVGDMELYQLASKIAKPQRDFDPVAVSLTYGNISFAIEITLQKGLQLPQSFQDRLGKIEIETWMNLMPAILRDVGPK